MNNSTKILIGVAAGVAAGVIAGILFAPAKGSDTRKKIVDQGKDLADKLSEKWGEAKKECASCQNTVNA